MAENEVNADLERGRTLLEHGRHDLAEKHLRLAVAREPDSWYAHYLLAATLRCMNRGAEAVKEANEAIRLAPYVAACHYARALALDQAELLDEADGAIREALRLDPEDPDFHAILASLHNQRQRWKEGLTAATAGLKFDPEHIECLHQQSLSLRAMGFADESHRVLETSLRADPENARSQASQGWNCLHRNDHRAALDHFREALRLQPDLEYARQGLVEALKARYVLYRLLLRYFLWIGTHSRGARWALMIGAYLFFRILVTAGDKAPETRPIVLPLAALYLVFCLLTWVGVPTFNLVLRLSRDGRYALSPLQIAAANWFGGFLATGVVLIAVGVAIQVDPVWMLGAWFVVMVQPVGVSLKLESAKNRRTAVVLAAGLGAVGLLCLGFHFFAPAGAGALPALIVFAIGWVLFPWIGRSLA
jgi:Flp pilus assembly protein TadD